METIIPNLKQFTDEIRDTCFVKVKNNDDIGILYYKSGRMINARINDELNKRKSDTILNWGNTTFEKIKIDSVTKFKSEDLKYIFDVIEFNGISSDIYIKQKGNIIVLGFSEGSLVSVMPEMPVTKEFINELINTKGRKIRMKQTAEKNGDIKIFISELMD